MSDVCDPEYDSSDGRLWLMGKAAGPQRVCERECVSLICHGATEVMSAQNQSYLTKKRKTGHTFI